MAEVFKLSISGESDAVCSLLLPLQLPPDATQVAHLHGDYFMCIAENSSATFGERLGSVMVGLAHSPTGSLAVVDSRFGVTHQRIELPRPPPQQGVSSGVESSGDFNDVAVVCGPGAHSQKGTVVNVYLAPRSTGNVLHVECFLPILSLSNGAFFVPLVNELG